MTDSPTRTVESATQATILTLLRDDGPLSRVDLADRVAVSGTTIAAEVMRLAELGLTADGGPAASRGGRRSTLVELAHAVGFVGIDIGSTSIDVALTDPRIDVIAQRAQDIDIREGPQRVLSRVLHMVRELREESPTCASSAPASGCPDRWISTAAARCRLRSCPAGTATRYASS